MHAVMDAAVRGMHELFAARGAALLRVLMVAPFDTGSGRICRDADNRVILACQGGALFASDIPR
jgi:hypothetical protein